MKIVCNVVALTSALVIGASAAIAPAVEEVVTVALPGLAPRVDSPFNRQGLLFEPNVGQTDAEVQFLARGPGYQLFLTATEAVMVLNPGSDSPDTPPGFGVRQPSAAFRGNVTATPAPQNRRIAGPAAEGTGPVQSYPVSDHRRVLHMRLVEANDSPSIHGEVQLPSKVNYFIGNDATRWQTNISTFAKVQYRDVYPGTDLVYYSNQEGRLEYDFVLAPGADPNLIALEFDGADRIAKP